MLIRLEQSPEITNQNFKMMKRSDLKTNIKKFFLKQYIIKRINGKM